MSGLPATDGNMTRHKIINFYKNTGMKKS